MHLVIAGPYEVLYTTAVDIWSFGCLLLNMLIGKSGPLKQRGVSLLICFIGTHIITLKEQFSALIIRILILLS